jgi:thioesterase domain-containing protein
MTADDFTAFLHDNIPLTRALQVRVAELDTAHIKLSAPLAPNLNHHGTAFGGSLAALGILAGWCAVHHGLSEQALDAVLVVRHSSLDYLRPGTGELHAESRLPQPQWTAFVERLRRGGRARLEIDSRVFGDSGDAVLVRGVYVATPRRTDAAASD